MTAEPEIEPEPAAEPETEAGSESEESTAKDAKDAKRDPDGPLAVKETESASEPEAEPESESELEHKAGSEPEPEAPSLILAPAGAWQPPTTFGDRFSQFSDKLIQSAVVVAGLVVLVTFVLWAVPSYAVATSDAYALAKARVQKDRLLLSFIGRPVTAEAIPHRYTLTDAGGSFTFVVRGTMGRAAVEAQVDGERVTRYRQHLAIDWTRPLLDQVGSK